MSSSKEAPDLTALLREARSSRSRGRGRPVGAPTSSPSITPSLQSVSQSNANHNPSGSSEKKDRIVQQTDQDASVSRMSAVELGYLDDQFAQDFMISERQRRLPIINRGTYVRTTAIDKLVYSFLESPISHQHSQKQVISIGAGTDTRPFRIFCSHAHLQILYHELDFSAVTRQKLSCIKRSPTLTGCLFPAGALEKDYLSIRSADDSFYTDKYSITPIDLRSLASAPSTPLHNLIPNFDSTAPTLVISECCLVYMPPETADGIVSHFNRAVSGPLGIVIYEPTNPNDAFGQVMQSNLLSRGISLPTLKKYGSLEAQKERLRVASFGERFAMDVERVWEAWTSEEEKDRVGSLEMLDEVEEWKMLAQHYCVIWGWRDQSIEQVQHDDKEASEVTRELNPFQKWSNLPS